MGPDDGLADGLAVRIVPPPAMGADEAQAVAEVAARLGHETMSVPESLVLDPASGWTGGVLRIGSGDDGAAASAGWIAVTRAHDVAVGGGGAEARAAALRLLARDLPQLPGGGSLADLREAALAVCERAAPGATCAVTRLEGRDLAWRRVGATLSVVLADGDPAAVCEALRSVLDPGPIGLADLTVEVAGSRGEARAALEAQPAGRSAVTGSVAAPPAPRLDLSRLYGTDGLLADTDGDLVADLPRARLRFSADCGPAELAAAADVAARMGMESVGLALPLDGPHEIRIAPAAAGAPASVTVVAGAAAALDVRGAAAARWLAAGAPGPVDDVDPVRRAVEDVRMALTGRHDAAAPDTEVDGGAVELPWEVDRVREAFAREVLPHVHAGAAVALDVRVSEPEDVRRELAAELAAALRARGAEPQVRVLDAYKPGLSWLLEDVAPRLAASPGVRELVISCAALRRPGDADWYSPQLLKELDLIDKEAAKALAAKMQASPEAPWWDPPTRWLLELYPADELLPIPPDAIRFEVVDGLQATYAVSALGADGAPLWDAELDVACSERPFLDAYPELGLVHPTTGRLAARVDGELVADVRIPTDLETIWDHFQGTVLPALERHVSARAGGAITAAGEPYFSVVDFDLEVSESDVRIPVRAERVSAQEMLHEDLYFVTLEYLSQLGLRSSGESLDGPGQVVPRIHARLGRGPRFAWSLRDVPPSVGGAVPLAGGARASREGVRVTRVAVDELGAVTDVGIAVELDPAAAPASARERIERLGTLAVAASVSLDAGPAIRLPAGAGTAERAGRAAPASALDVHADALGRLAADPSVTVYDAARSVQGRRVPVVEIALPAGDRRISQAKRVAWKPTLLINARHHGNEPSSTWSSLELAGRLAEGGDLADRRRRVNVVLIPLENADGATLADRLLEEHEDWIFHAGRFNALGREFRSEYGNEDTRSREARVLPDTWRRWLPDIVFDDHGGPAHEWVQMFSGYVPMWPSYWLPRGIFYAYMKYVREPGRPGHGGLAEALRDRIAGALSADAGLTARTREWRERYVKYGNEWLPELFPLEEHEGWPIYFSASAVDPGGDWSSWGTDFTSLHPDVTPVSIVTEVPDETALGEDLDACVAAHVAANVAALELLAGAGVRPQRELRATAAGTYRSAVRRRPL